MSRSYHWRLMPDSFVVGSVDMLLIAADVLADSDRWWSRHRSHVADGIQLGDLYKLLHQMSVEGQACWSALDDQGSGLRVHSTRLGLLPMSILLQERDDHLIVRDFRIPPPRRS